MTKHSLRHLIELSILTSAALLLLSAHAHLQDRDDDRRDIVRLPTGQFVTPTAIDDSVQQYLNPGLASYPNFVAGEAVRSRLSPDGGTLAVLTAGQNSLYKSDGTVDAANSTQYIFIYNVEGAHK